ncbi:hypothetical protein [Archangium lipolyticum]|uniref:hypothetical protein n=1 Tax=Archangium lipolyticum TaxID=2970465 RepID=UPI002149DAAE|nr:hypothetical protein [Archangium lipolyticum]
MNTQGNRFTPVVQHSQRHGANLALQRFLEQHPAIESVQDFINHCHARGGEALFHGRCRELGLDPNELYTSRTAELADWVCIASEEPATAESLLAVG